MKGLWRAAVAALLLTACAKNDAVSLLASNDQQAVTRDGSPALISAKRNVVMLKASGEEMESGERPTFVVALQNMQADPVNLSPNRITARVLSADGTFRPLKVYSYAELVAEEKRRQTMAAVGAVLVGVSRGISAANAGYSNTNGSFNAYNSYGASAHGTYSSRSYNAYQAYSAQQLANAQTSADFAAIRDEGAYNLQRLQGTIIKAHTLAPGEWYGGTIVLDKPKKDKTGSAAYSVSIELDGEEHVFHVRQQRVSR
jgi:hypothetical protein